MAESELADDLRLIPRERDRLKLIRPTVEYRPLNPMVKHIDWYDIESFQIKGVIRE